MKFVQDFEKEVGFNPLIQGIAIASACHYLWRSNQMKPKTIATEPIVGWDGLRMNQSVVALHWLYNQDKKLGGNRIKHSPNEGEQVILLKEGKVKVDGYDPVTKTVYEFHGCEFDGCKKCKPNNRHVKAFRHPDRTVHEMFKATKKKIKLIEEACYKVVETWECHFKKELKTNEDLKNMVTDMAWCTPLDPRERFYGGRTGLCACYYETKEGEKIAYNDVTSLYPFINKHGTYPAGNPTIMVNPVNQNIHEYFGLAKVGVLAPEKLFHPVLPVRIKRKVMFSLCGKCAEDQQSLPGMSVRILAHTVMKTV